MHFHSRVAAILALALTFALVACTPNPADEVPAAAINDPSGQPGAPSGSDAASAPTDGAAAADSAAPADSSAASDTAASDLAGAYPGASNPSTAGGAATGGYPAPVGESGAVEGSAGGAAAEVSGNPIALAGTIAFLASKVTRTHHIVFQEWTGTLDPGTGTPESAKLSFTVDTASAISDPDDRGMMSERLDTHLKSDEFFDVEKYPTATFVSTSIAEGGENGATHTITGDLTVHGITKTITFPANVTVAGDQVNATAEFSLNRQDFGLIYPGQPDDLVRDEVVMQIAVNGTL